MITKSKIGISLTTSIRDEAIVLAADQGIALSALIERLLRNEIARMQDEREALAARRKALR